MQNPIPQNPNSRVLPTNQMQFAQQQLANLQASPWYLRLMQMISALNARPVNATTPTASFARNPMPRPGAQPAVYNAPRNNVGGQAAPFNANPWYQNILKQARILR